MIPSCPTQGWWVVCLILPVCLFVVRVAVALASSASPSAHESAMLMEWPASAVGGLWVLVFVCLLQARRVGCGCLCSCAGGRRLSLAFCD